MGTLEVQVWVTAFSVIELTTNIQTDHVENDAVIVAASDHLQYNFLGLFPEPPFWQPFNVCTGSN